MAGEVESGLRTPRPMRALECTTALHHRVAGRFLRQLWSDARAMSTRRQPCNSCRQQTASLASLPAALGQVATNAFNCRSAQASDSSIRLGYQETAPSFERHDKRSRLDLDDAVTPADVQRRAWLDRGFTTDLGRNHESASRVDGSGHGMKYTISLTMRRRA